MLRRAVGVLALLASAGCQSPAQVPDLNGRCDQPLDYDLALPRFDETAQQIAHATGCMVVTDTQRTGAIAVRPVQGRYSPRQAIAQAIAGSPLRIVRQTPNSLEVR